MMEWRNCFLDEIIQIIGGGTPKTTIEEYWSGNIPWLSVVDFGNDQRWVAKTEKTITEKGLKNSSTKLLEQGDLILSARGTVGEIAQLTKPMAFNQSCYGLSAKPPLSNDFLYYLIKYNLLKLRRNTHGSVFSTITRETFKSIDVKYPEDENERNTIEKTFTLLDSKIENLQRQNQTLEKIAQTLFKQWFVDFNFPDENGKPYKDSGGEMMASELGAIPKGWQIEGFLESFTLMSGGTPKTSVPDYWNGDIKWISAKDITANHKKFILDTEKKITDDGANKSAAKLLPKYSIIISARGTVGKYCILPEEMCISQSNYGIAAKRPNIHFYTYLLVANVINQLQAQAYGSVFDTITTRIFKCLQIVMPAETTLDLFIEVIESFFKKIQLNSEQIQTLTQARDTLLPKLMSGQIRIKD